MFRFTRLIQYYSVTSKQKTLLLLAAPGVSRGAYAQLLLKDLDYKYLSMDQEIRKIIEGPTGNKFNMSEANVKTILKFTHSDKFAQAILQIISEPQLAQGIILDGFPKTKGQLDKYLELHPLHCALNLIIKTDVLVQRSLGRQICQNCAMSYNTAAIQRDGYSMEAVLPKVEGICNQCGENLIVPQGFSQAQIRSRLQRYQTRTRPILQSLDKLGVLINYQIKDMEKDYPEIKRLVEAKMAML